MFLNTDTLQLYLTEPVRKTKQKTKQNSRTVTNLFWKPFVHSFQPIINNIIKSSLCPRGQCHFLESTLTRRMSVWRAWMLCSWVWAWCRWQRVPGHKSHGRKGIFVWPRCSLDALPSHPVRAHSLCMSRTFKIMSFLSNARKGRTGQVCFFCGFRERMGA